MGIGRPTVMPLMPAVRMLAAMTAAAAVIASCSSPHASAPRAQPTSPAHPVIELAQQPDANFSVGPPQLLASTQPAWGPPPGPTCTAANVHSSAALRSVPAGNAHGTAGVLTLQATGCILRVDGYVIRLLDASGHDLDVPIRTPPMRSAARPIVSEARLGFLWSGRYCGPRPAFVEVTVPGRPLALRIPIPAATPIPGCTGSEGSHLALGDAVPSGSVMPVPDDWRSLQARLVLPATVQQGEVPLVVVLSTSSAAGVSLAGICPSYAVTASIHTEYTPVHNSFGYQTGGTGDLCSKRVVVRPGKPVTLTLGTVPTDTQGATWWPGSALRVEWAMPGVPIATGSATVL
jgi:hypothetical protein